jgi:hypothetical protein
MGEVGSSTRASIPFLKEASMSTNSGAHVPASPHPNQRLWCAQCEADDRLKIDSIEASPEDDPEVVKATYSCTKCMTLYTHPARAADVAAIVNAAGPRNDVLQFGNYYIHCGAPMAVSATELRSIYSPMRTDRSPSGGSLLDVYLRTRVLHCPCGFQMEIPR